MLADERSQRTLFEQWMAETGRWAERRRDQRGDNADKPCLWSLGLNRKSLVAIKRSVPATKSDAARRVFDIKCSDLAWAVVDTGIDAGHQAFRSPAASGNGATSRVRATYDFTGLRQLLSLDSHPTTGPSVPMADVDLEEADRRFKRACQRLRSGQSLDRAQLEPLLDISYGRTTANSPRVHDHGTHVAGIIGACDEEEQ